MNTRQKEKKCGDMRRRKGTFDEDKTETRNAEICEEEDDKKKCGDMRSRKRRRWIFDEDKTE